jgi:transposase
MATAVPTDLTDSQWTALAALLPPPARCGRPRADDRRTLNGILWVLRTGARWADLPARYGAASTCHRRLQQWHQRGVWERLWRALLARLDAQQRLDWHRGYLDGTFIAAKRGGEAVGLTRRGKGTKLLAVVDGAGIPLGLHVASAQQAEVRLADATLATIRVPQARGRPKTRPQELVADKGYDSMPFRERLRGRGVRPCIPYRRGRRPRPGPPPRLAGYRERWRVERTFAWLGTFRRVLVRHERQAGLYAALVLLAAIILCLRRALRGPAGALIGASG